MRKLVFKTENIRQQRVLQFLYKIFVSDTDATVERKGIRQMSRVSQVLEKYVVPVPAEDDRNRFYYTVDKQYVDAGQAVMELETGDFDFLYECVKRYKVTNAEANVADDLRTVFEKALEDDKKDEVSTNA